MAEKREWILIKVEDDILEKESISAELKKEDLLTKSTVYEILKAD